MLIQHTGVSGFYSQLLFAAFCSFTVVLVHMTGFSHSAWGDLDYYPDFLPTSLPQINLKLAVTFLFPSQIIGNYICMVRKHTQTHTHTDTGFN